MSGAREHLQQARQLKAAGRLEEALAANLRAVAADAGSAVAEHNLAAMLGDLSRHAEAVAATARAFTKGGDAPETWLVRARALQGTGELDEAEQAFEAALARRPDYLDAHRDLAQLRWMRTGDLARALTNFDAAPAPLRDHPAMLMTRARVLGGAGDRMGALAALNRAVQQAPREPVLRLAAARAAGEAGDAALHLAHADAAAALAPGSPEPVRARVAALLHLGRAEEAAFLAEGLVAAQPDDQGLIGLLAAAWRLLGDPRHAALCEDPALIAARQIKVPEGWPPLEPFLAELAAALEGLHVWKTHPLEQSVRHGSQSNVDLLRSEVPAIRALFTAVAPAIDAHLAALGPGSDPVRRRNRGRWRIATAWSIRLPPGGFHSDHVHPEGWLSSALHIAVPEATNRGHEGWLAFGRPGIPTQPSLEPFARVRPEPGTLVLFPSYLWHGTEPFGGDQPRLTVAFDVVPA